MKQNREFEKKNFYTNSSLWNGGYATVNSCELDETNDEFRIYNKLTIQ